MFVLLLEGNKKKRQVRKHLHSRVLESVDFAVEYITFGEHA